VAPSDRELSIVPERAAAETALPADALLLFALVLLFDRLEDDVFDTATFFVRLLLVEDVCLVATAEAGRATMAAGRESAEMVRVGAPDAWPVAARSTSSSR
jgi:hypothetical protein